MGRGGVLILTLALKSKLLAAGRICKFSTGSCEAAIRLRLKRGAKSLLFIIFEYDELLCELLC